MTGQDKTVGGRTREWWEMQRGRGLTQTMFTQLVEAAFLSDDAHSRGIREGLERATKAVERLITHPKDCPAEGKIREERANELREQDKARWLRALGPYYCAGCKTDMTRDEARGHRCEPPTEERKLPLLAHMFVECIHAVGNRGYCDVWVRDEGVAVSRRCGQPLSAHEPTR